MFLSIRPDVRVFYLGTSSGCLCFILVSVFFFILVNGHKELIGSSDLSSPVIGLHSVGRFISGRFCWVYLGIGEFLRPQGAFPPGLYPLRGVGFIAWRLRRPKKGNADGAEGIFDLAGCVWASALRPDPP